MYRVALRRAAASLAILFLSGLFSSASALEAHIFRGLGDFSFISPELTFSKGMNTLADEFNAAGIPARSYRWDEADAVYRDIMRRRPDAVALIGHSMGAVASIALARRLEGSGIRVAYLGTVDIPGPASVVSSNVEVAENYYHAFPVFGHLGKPAGYRGTLKNEFVTGQIHITMDKARVVHQEMLAAVTGIGQPERAETLQAFAAEPERKNSEDLMARVEKVLKADAATNGTALASGYVGIDPVVEPSPKVDRTAMTAAIDQQPPHKYNTKSGLPPIE